MPSKTLIKPVILPFKGKALENRLGDVITIVQKAAQIESSIPATILFPGMVKFPKNSGGVFISKKIKDDRAEGLIEARVVTKLKNGEKLEERISLVSEILQIQKQVIFKDGVMFFVQEGVDPTFEKDGKIYGIPSETVLRHYITIKKPGMPPLRMKIQRDILFTVVEELLNHLDPKNKITLLKFARNWLLYPWPTYPPYETNNNVASVLIS